MRTISHFILRADGYNDMNLKGRLYVDMNGRVHVLMASYLVADADLLDAV